MYLEVKGEVPLGAKPRQEGHLACVLKDRWMWVVLVVDLVEE